MSALLLVLATGAAIVGVDQLARHRARQRVSMSQADWTRLARRCGLTVCDLTSPRRLRGVVDGVSVTVCVEELPRALRFQVCAALPVVLPPNTLVTARPGAVGDMPLRSPILRGMLHACGGSRVRALLDDPALVGPLMAVFKPHPGALLDARSVQVSGDTERARTALPEVIADAVALSAAVGAAWRGQSAQ